MTKRLAMAVFAALILFGLWQFFHFFPELPARVVTQQTAAGKASLIMGKPAVAAIYFLILIGFGAYFLGCGLFVKRLPDRYLKVLPNRDHWLAPERREATMRSLATFLLWLGVATLGMFQATFLCIFLVNTGRAEMSIDLATNFFTTLYLTYIFFSLIVLKNRFRTDTPRWKRPPEKK